MAGLTPWAGTEAGWDGASGLWRPGLVGTRYHLFRVVSIVVDSASQRVDLEQIRRDPSVVVPELKVDAKVYTAAELAEEIGVTRRALNLVIQNMRSDGHLVGLRPGMAVYTDKDAQSIRTWRQEHPRGRPKKMKAPS